MTTRAQEILEILPGAERRRSILSRRPRRQTNIDQVNPEATTMRVSARTGEGVDALREWLIGVPARVGATA